MELEACLDTLKPSIYRLLSYSIISQSFSQEEFKLIQNIWYGNILVCKPPSPPPDEMNCIFIFNHKSWSKMRIQSISWGEGGWESFLINLTICRCCQKLCLLHVVDGGHYHFIGNGKEQSNFFFLISLTPTWNNINFL